MEPLPSRAEAESLLRECANLAIANDPDGERRAHGYCRQLIADGRSPEEAAALWIHIIESSSESQSAYLRSAWIDWHKQHVERWCSTPLTGEN